MFDGISLNHRMLGSMFDQTSTSVARPAQEARTYPRMNGKSYCIFSFKKMFCCYEMIESVEVASNFRPKKFWAQCSTHMQSTLKFVRSFSPITTIRDEGSHQFLPAPPAKKILC